MQPTAQGNPFIQAVPGVNPTPPPSVATPPTPPAPIDFGSMVTEPPPPINQVAAPAESQAGTFPTLQEATAAKNEYPTNLATPAQPPISFGQPPTESVTTNVSFPAPEPVLAPPPQPAGENISPFGAPATPAPETVPIPTPGLNVLSNSISEQLKPTEESKTPITEVFMRLNEMLQGARGNPALEQIILNAAQKIVNDVAQNQNIPPGAVVVNTQT
jgi:hypothetical protein